MESLSVTSVHVKYCICYIIKTVSRLLLTIQACNMVESRCFVNINIILDSAKPKSHSVTSIHVT